MKKNIIIISLTFILGLASCSFTSSNFDQTDKDKLLLQLISYVLDQGHFVEKEINDSTKEMIKKINPSNPDIDKRLFKDLGDQYVFEQSLRPFHSNPSTTIPNDQEAFSEFCYGSMISCKEGNDFACARNLSRYNNY